MADDSYDVVPLPDPPQKPANDPPPPPVQGSTSTAAEAAVDAAENMEDVDYNRPMAVLAYMGPFVVVPLVFARESRFARFHANQGLLLFMLEFGLWAINWVLGFLFMPAVWTSSSDFFLGLAHIYGFVAGVIWAIFVMLSFVGILHAIAGAEDKLPAIGNFRIVKL